MVVDMLPLYRVMDKSPLFSCRVPNVISWPHRKSFVELAYNQDSFRRFHVVHHHLFACSLGRWNWY